jgi:hypothetical protein
VRESKGMEVRHGRTDTMHASIDVKRMRDVLVTALQDDAVFLKGDTGDSIAIHGAAMESDNVWITIVFDEL